SSVELTAALVSVSSRRCRSDAFMPLYRKRGVELTHVLLFFHLLGAFCFFAGGAVVGVLQLAAIRQERPSQVYAFLRFAPFGAALVGTGALLTLGFGIGLA